MQSRGYEYDQCQWCITDAKLYLAASGDRLCSSAFELLGGNCPAVQICVSFVSRNQSGTNLSFQLLSMASSKEVLPPVDGRWVVYCDCGSKDIQTP